MGSHWSLSTPKHRMSPTPAGTKKKPRLWTRKSAIFSTCDRRTMPSFSPRVSSSIPIMLDGTGTPVSMTTSSPSERKANNTPH